MTLESRAAAQLDHRQHALEFFFSTNGARAGTGGNAPDVDDRRALFDHALGGRERRGAAS